MVTPPPRRSRPTISLFAAVASTVVEKAEKRKEEPRRESVNLWPHVVLHIYPDGTAGAESPLKDATWERMDYQAAERLEVLRREIAFIERWAAAKKRTSVELRV